MKSPFLLSILSALLIGCVSNQPHAEFTGSITFSSLQTFSYKQTLITGMDFRESEKQVLEELSKETLTEAFSERGFKLVKTGSDFFVVTKWEKAASSYPDVFDHVDGFHDSLNRRDDPSYRFASRLHLTVEVHETSSGNLFWRKELPNIFNASQLNKERIVASLQRAIADFPERVEKDPDLPDIE